MASLSRILDGDRDISNLGEKDALTDLGKAAQMEY
jgi:hypothetical protein